MVAGAIAAALVARGERVAAYKPVVTGTDEPANPDWPPDHELLAGVTGQPPDAVTPHRFGPAVSPHLAAELAAAVIDPAELVSAARSAGERADALVAEGVGGLLVPLTPGYLVRDLARELGLPVVVAARAGLGTISHPRRRGDRRRWPAAHPGLGTINHCLLTIEAARDVGLAVRRVVLTPWPEAPGQIERSNHATIATLGATDVATLPALADAGAAGLAAAGARLPLDAWLE